MTTSQRTIKLVICLVKMCCLNNLDENGLLQIWWPFLEFTIKPPPYFSPRYQALIIDFVLGTRILIHRL